METEGQVEEAVPTNCGNSQVHGNQEEPGDGANPDTAAHAAPNESEEET